MRKKLLCALLLGCFLLSGCGSMLDRSYEDSSPHIQFSDEDQDPSILRAETYQGMVSALLHLVGQGEPDGIIRLYQYVSVTGSASSDVDQACREVTQEDSLGAWAVDYIKYDVGQTPAYYEVNVKLAYTRSPEEIRQVISVTGSSAIPRELVDLLPSLPTQAIFRSSYFTARDSAAPIRQGVLAAYASQSLPLPPLEAVTVNLYPNQGQQRVAEILLSWGPEEPQ